MLWETRWSTLPYGLQWVQLEVLAVGGYVCWFRGSERCCGKSFERIRSEVRSGPG